MLQEQKELAIDVFARKGKGSKSGQLVKVEEKNKLKEGCFYR